MKKFLLAILTFTLTCCSLLFVGCKKTEGTYKLSGLAYLQNGTTHKVALGEKYNGLALQEDTFILTINEDNTAIMRTRNNDETEGSVFQWTKGYEDEVYLYTLEDSETCIFKKTDDGYVLDFYEIQLFFVKD